MSAPILPPLIITTTAPDADEFSSSVNTSPSLEYALGPPITPPSHPANLSPSDAMNDADSSFSPASPTLSASSVRFSTPEKAAHTSLVLRDNHPDVNSGKGTLDVVDHDRADHRRRASNATWVSDITAADHSDTHTDSAFINQSEKTAFEQKTGKMEDVVEKEEAQFKLDVENEAASAEDIGPFTLFPKKLASLVDPKSIPLLQSFGGTAGVLEALGTHPTKGLDDAVLASSGAGSTGTVVQATSQDRKRVYGTNTLPSKKPKSLLYLVWLALKDKVLIILMVAAMISLALGLYTDLGRPPKTVLNAQGELVEVPAVDWVEGVAILVAVAVVSLVGATNDWQKEKQFQKLNAQKEDRGLKVIRSGREQIISVYEVVVGDIAILEPGEIVPVDGIFLRGHAVKCDESGATGESDAIKKVTYEECLAEREGKEETEKGFKNDCFMVSGGKILEGVGEYLVIAVGPNSFNGRTLMALRGDTPATPLQLKLNALAELIAKLGSLAGLILFSSLMIRFFVQLGTGNPPRSASDKGDAFIDILIISVTIVVVAVPEGLPLAVTLALAFATKRMTKENLLVRLLGACETMGNATVVCTDKTGTLTQNSMSVVAGSVGINAKFVQRLEENQGRTNAEEARRDFSLEMSTLNTILNQETQDLFNQAIVLNSTAFEDKDPESGEMIFVGSKTETALLRFAKELGWKDYKTTRESAKISQMLPFSSERKSMGVVVELPNGKHRVYFKGASEILLRLCSSYLEVSQTISSDKIETKKFTEDTRDNIERTIILYANNMLRTIAICYRDIESWPSADMDENGEVPFTWLARDLTLLAVTGIEDPLRPGVTESVMKCSGAGVAVKMCTGDNVLTARSIATQCGIYTPGGLIMEGPVFRELSRADLHAIVPRLQVLARSSPEDKKILVATLQDLGEVVGVTGDGTNDGPALKQADVGFSMGIAGTEVAKEASDIILMDDNFSSIVSAVCWGRCVNDSVSKFLQFQISVNITAVVITFVSAVASADEQSVLTAVQLLWVNLIMDTFAALALATDPATPTSLLRKPTPKTAPLITIDMFKMILGQALFQIIACLILHFLGGDILNNVCSDELTCNQQQQEVSTIVFNAFVFCQIFNQLNCRRLDRKLNIFTRDFFRNYYFFAIFGIMVGGQIAIVFVGGSAFQVVRITGRDWAISIIVGALSLPLAVIIRLLPTEPFAKVLYALKIYKDPSKLPKVNPDAEQHEWNEAITKTIDNLSTYRTIRGGRLQSSSMAFKSRSAMMEKKDIRPMSLLAMVPTLIASSVGAGWQPSSNDLGNPSQDPSASSVALWRGKVQIHPDTDKSDPFWQRFGAV
ncbi:calcium-translocating p-type atpase [Phaffia rhodozyma]|uniref:Calcium-transporting ATPase n=1 Tax=Phaffia rhodozyma TaxID=264483 RepID=A0A0F7SQ77_PHARH|nr:calcium-translocating p-type atpase [Phaffia rhodozyma]